MALCPPPNGLKVLTFVSGIEVRVWEGTFSFALKLYLNLTKHTHIRRAHELLAQCVHAVSDVVSDHMVIVKKGSLFSIMVVLVVPPQRFSHEALQLSGYRSIAIVAVTHKAMKMIQSFDVRRESSTIFLANFYLIWS